MIPSPWLPEFGETAGKCFIISHHKKIKKETFEIRI